MVVAVHLAVAVAVVAVGQQSAGQWMHCWAVDRLVLWLYQMACIMACTRGHDSQSAKQCAVSQSNCCSRSLAVEIDIAKRVYC